MNVQDMAEFTREPEPADTTPGVQLPAGFFLDYPMKGGRIEHVMLVQPAPQPAMKLLPQPGVGR